MQFFSRNSRVSPEEFETIEQAITPYGEHLKTVVEKGGYSKTESSLCLPSDEKLLRLSEEAVNVKSSPALRYIFVVGIGGSDLGTKAVYDAIFGYYDGIEPHRFPKIIFLETADATHLHRMQGGLSLSELNPKEFVVVIVSKSGTTTETIANSEVLIHFLKGRESELLHRIVVITELDSILWKAAEAQGITTLPIPKTVGGRYSVFSPVGVFPLMMCGIDVHDLLEGARDMREQCLKPQHKENPALASAAVLFTYYEQGLVVHDSFFFHPALESLGKWYRQLVGESLGKENIKKSPVGILPTVSLGSTDLHSVGQLYFGGPKRSVTTFISVINEPATAIPTSRLFPELEPRLANKRMNDVLLATLKGTKLAYQNHGLPFLETELSAVNARELGKYLMWKMMEVMFLAQLLEVNAFDQPNVEAYKKETRAILDFHE
ncbi:MAG: hypothetical protein AAB407_03870 [Patescibacteria group bacterium]